MVVTTEKPAIGVLTLGQTPRPDLVRAVQTILPNAAISIRGGLDDLSAGEVASLRAGPNPHYALLVRLANGESMTVDMNGILPNLEKQAELLARDGARQIVLMCSSGFAAFSSPVPVLRPVMLFRMYADILAVRRRVGTLSPIRAQVPAASAYWQNLGYTAFSDFASPSDPEEVCAKANALAENDVDCLLLDCIGFTQENLRQVQETVPMPVLLPMKLVQMFFHALSYSDSK